MAKIYPPKKFVQSARIKTFAQYNKLYKKSISQPVHFWRDESKGLVWQNKWLKLLQWKNNRARWFLGGKINLSYNCIDRHLLGARKNKAAIIWEGETGEERVLTYLDLHREVCKFANVLKHNGIKKNDRIIIYMPLVPEAAIAMLACTRIGAIHSVVFGGFSSQALIDRVDDCKAKMIITADGGFRRGAIIPLKINVDKALKKASVKKVIVLKRTGQKISLRRGRDLWWHEEMEKVRSNYPITQFNSEQPLFILYTSGSTGKPKGILHTTAGYLMGAYLTTKYVFDIKDEDTFWCTADIGWITGHSYTVYGALLNGATTFMYEGALYYPEPDRAWKLIDKYQVSVFYTAPTAIRSFMKWGDVWPQNYDLSSLRLLGTVGEPINPNVWLWFYRTIGKKKCPIVDTWWQTETGSHAITTVPGAHPMKPGSAGMPFFGYEMAIVDRNGKEVADGENGLLVIKKPWPSMLRGIYGDEKRYHKQYWSDIPNNYFTGDGAKRDKDGYFWITGRVDDVLNVSGHRIGTAEVESALVSHPSVAEAAVVGIPHEIKGQEIVAFVTPRLGAKITKKFIDELRFHVAKEIGSFAKPGTVRLTEALPTTRSGKIMRRLLREIATTSEVKGDITTLEDFSVIAKLKK